MRMEYILTVCWQKNKRKLNYVTEFWFNFTIVKQASYFYNSVSWPLNQMAKYIVLNLLLSYVKLSWNAYPSLAQSTFKAVVEQLLEYRCDFESYKLDFSPKIFQKLHKCIWY